MEIQFPQKYTNTWVQKIQFSLLHTLLYLIIETHFANIILKICQIDTLSFSRLLWLFHIRRTDVSQKIHIWQNKIDKIQCFFL